MDLGSLGLVWSCRCQCLGFRVNAGLLGWIWGHWDRFGVAELNVEVLGSTLGSWGCFWGHWDQFGVAEVNVDVLGSTLGSWDGFGVTGTGLELQMSMFRV